MILTYSRKNKLISLMRLLVDRIKIFDLMRSHQISQISHFRIKYEYLVSHLKEKILRHAFLPIFFFIPFVAFVIKAGEFSYLLRNPFFFQIRFNHISKTARLCFQTIILQYVKILTFLLQSRFLYYFIKSKSLPNFVCSFIFDELTPKVRDVSAVFL